MKTLDTTVAVDHLRNVPEAMLALTAVVGTGEPLVASEIVRFELLVGQRPDETERMEAFFAAVEWIPVNEVVAREAAALARQFRATHSGIDDADYVIAATARLLDAPLLTRNVRHFPMFDGLQPPY